MVTRKKDTTTDTTKGIVVNQLVIKTLNRQTQSIDKWRTALKSADNGRITQLYNMYQDILTDNVLKNAIGKRIRPITNAGLTFTINNEEVPEINDLIKTKAFRLLLKEIMLAKMWGVTVVETSYDKLFNVFSIPRTHINTKNSVIGVNEGDDFGISYINDPFLIAIEGEERFGEILAACPYVIYKRGNFGDWAQFAELFGMPFRLGKYDSFDEAGRLQLTEALDKAGSAAYAVVPKNTDLEYIANNSTGDGRLYDNLRKACNEEILIGILGQTMTTVQGDKGARSLGEVHQEVEGGIHADDRIFVETILNTEVLPRLEARGFKVSGGTFAYPELGETISLKDRITIDTALDKIVEIEADYFYETYGINKPKDGGGKKSAPPATPDRVPNPVGGEKTTPPKKEKVKLSDVETGHVLSDPADNTSFWERFFDFFVAAPQAGANQNFIAKSISSITGNIKLADDYSININELVNEAFQEIFDTPETQGLFNLKLFEITNNSLQQAITVEIAKETEGWGKTNAGFIQQFRENTAVFAAFKNHQQTNEIVSLLVDENGNTRSFSKFKKLALGVSQDYNVNWLQTEYNTAIRSSRAAFNFLKYLETEHLYPNLEYLESVAGHKREDHLSYVGTVLPIRHTWWKIHLPPGDWNCQCSVRPSNKPATAVPDDNEPVDPVFANNPGETAKMVNTEATPYYTNTDPDKRQEISDAAIELLLKQILK